MLKILKHLQELDWEEELRCVQTEKAVSRKSWLHRLDLFESTDAGIPRVRGRLQMSIRENHVELYPVRSLKKMRTLASPKVKKEWQKAGLRCSLTKLFIDWQAQRCVFVKI
jgi:hypothetical protein